LCIDDILVLWLCYREALPWGPATDDEEGCWSAKEVIHDDCLVEHEVESVRARINQGWVARLAGEGEYICEVPEEDVVDRVELHVPHCMKIGFMGRSDTSLSTSLLQPLLHVHLPHDGRGQRETATMISASMFIVVISMVARHGKISAFSWW
jgi:hypothetical protein